MRNVNCIVLSAPDTASASGSAIDANQLVSASFQAVFADTSVAGTLQIQASNDIYNDRYNFPEGKFQPTNWTNVPSGSATVTAGASALILLPQIAYRWLRVVFTESTPGTSTIQVNMNALSM